jgi:tRNA (guanine37-N1)-methyltransferase
MEVPCVRVAREDGEQARKALAKRALLDNDHEITVADGRLFIPVTDPAAVPDEYAVVTRDAPARETQVMPADSLGFEPSYERLGDIVLLDEDDDERAAHIAEAVMDSALPVKTVANRASKVTGEFRTREWDVLAGNGTETVHREYGCAFALNIEEVYFSPRLATERHRVTEQAGSDERVVDMFAGVGPFTIPFAARGAHAVGIDVNPVAVEYLRENARRNGVAEQVTALEGDVREVAADYEGWAERIVMNLPHTADEFLDTTIRLASDDCVIHYYDIQHEDGPYGPGERAIRTAADGYEVTVETRRTVRSYAPHELNVCLDVRLRAE